MRKFLLVIVLTLLLCPVVLARPRENFPLPHRPDTLRILAIGNSFSDDGTMYLPEILEGAGVCNVIVARLYIGGCSLERHCMEYDDSLNNYKYYKSTSNQWTLVNEHASLLQGIEDEPWDIVTLQQASHFSGLWESYVPWLDRLIGIVRDHCTNPEATIAWHQTWAYATNSTHGAFPKNYDSDQLKMYSMINDCLEKVQVEGNISVVIPTGNVVQYLRSTRLCGEKELTRDGFHLDYGPGRYSAACTWFEALVRPTLGVSVKKSRTRPEGTEHEISTRDARLCRKAAVKAVKAVGK